MCNRHPGTEKRRGDETQEEEEEEGEEERNVFQMRRDT